MSIKRNDLKRYADTYWSIPCRDGKVWLNNRPIIIDQERRRLGLGPSEWSAVFLNYEIGKYIDGLFFIKSSQVPNLPALQYYAPNIPPSDQLLVNDWRGLNDCAHFVSECLKAGGVEVYDLGVGSLVQKLRARADTKTLAHFVDVTTAERIVKSDIMAVGDIIAFGEADKTFNHHGHSVVYLGSNQVANHTHLNHPTFTGGDGRFGNGVWQKYAVPETGHPLVTLIHFAEGDPDPALVASTLGWWTVLWRGKPYFYYFERTGRVSYTESKPASVKHGPTAPVGKGYWFGRGSDLKICWTATGSLETFARNPSMTAMSGEWNGSEPITATQLA